MDQKRKQEGTPRTELEAEKFDENCKNDAEPKDIRDAEQKSKRKKTVVEDDGRTIADMNVEGFPWYDKHKGQRREYTKKERRQILKAAYMRMLPILGVMLLGLGIMAFLMWLFLGF